MSSELFPEFTDLVPPPHRCGYGTSLDNVCGKRATWHVLWSSRLDNGLECDYHHNVVRSRWVFYADHPFDPNCCLVGASYDEKLNRCYWPEDTSWWDAVEEWMAAPEREPYFQ